MSVILVVLTQVPDLLKGEVNLFLVPNMSRQLRIKIMNNSFNSRSEKFKGKIKKQNKGKNKLKQNKINNF